MTRRSPCSGVPGAGRPSMPKMPAMITSRVIACIRGASGNGLSSGQRSISRAAAASIIRVYWAIASPWNGGSSSLRWRMWRRPTAVRTELGPTIGRSGDSPVSEGASSGLAVKSERTWSGWLVMTVPPSIGAEHPEDLAELPPGAEHELDLALVEAQGLGPGRQRDRRRRRQGGGRGGVDRAGGGGRRLADQAAWGSVDGISEATATGVM